MLSFYLNLSFMLFLMFFMCMFFSMYFILFKMKLFIELNLINLNSLNFSLIFYFDYKTFIFMMTVFLISSMVVLYSLEYMSMDKFNMKFIYILMLFVISMIMMIIGQNLLMILLGWDGLGLISYCLVIYYNNWGSYNAGMLTILMNRLGDIGLLISIGIFSLMGSWNYLLMNLNSIYLFFMIMLSGLTKSAQIPFSSWLPLAMAAPTPISALVHSSTLVTAGIYLFIRMYHFLSKSLFIYFLFYLSMLTMFMAGMVASFENDFKKIIALSTLSQLGLMMMCLMMSYKLLSFFHLIIHAMFKSLLFMCAGLILHSSLNNQDIRYMGVMNKLYFYTLIMFNSSNLALCGFPFLSGFYSKDLILEMFIFSNQSLIIMLIFFLSIFFTVMYSMRLIFYMIFNYMKFYTYFSSGDLNLMGVSMFMVYFYSIIGGSLFSWLIFNSMNLIILHSSFKYMIYMMIIFGGLIGLFFYNMKFNMGFNLFMKSLFMMNYFNNFYIKNTLFLSGKIFNYLEKGWFEILSTSGLKLIYFNIMKIEKFNMLLMMKMLMIFLFMLFMMF